MTISAIPDDVRYFEDERLELVDKIQDRSAIRQLLMSACEALLGEPASTPTDGWVMRGFEVTHSPLSLSIDVTAVEGIAFDGDGKLVYNPGSAVFTITLPATAITRLYTYMRDVDTAQDARRRFDRTLGSEVAMPQCHGTTRGQVYQGEEISCGVVGEHGVVDLNV